MATSPRPIRSKFNTFEKELAAQRDALLTRVTREREEMIFECEPDDLCAEANRDLARHLLVSTLSKERETLGEIEIALKKLKAGEYGLCEYCGGSIAVNRLNALPWTRSCIGCAAGSIAS